MELAPWAEPAPGTLIPVSQDELRSEVAARYRHFAEVQAPGRSELYAEITAAVASCDAVLNFLAAMPRSKWQPNVLLAAVRYLYGTVASAQEFVELVLRHSAEIAALMAARTTQTNEPARCATLLPVLARLPQPLALLEVGASAGLCLLPDHYAYDYGTRRIGPSVLSSHRAPVFSCRASAATPLPDRNLEIVWRAGLDLHPLDLRDDSDLRWLEALVWPGEDHRLPRLRAACEIARQAAPRVVRGDLRSDVAALAAQAPADATLVVFHTAVLPYLSDACERSAFAAEMLTGEAVWIANEAPDCIPGIPDAVVAERPSGHAFLLCVDAEPTAWTDGHGSWVEWRSMPPSEKD